MAAASSDLFLSSSRNRRGRFAALSRNSPALRRQTGFQKKNARRLVMTLGAILVVSWFTFSVVQTRSMRLKEQQERLDRLSKPEPPQRLTRTKPKPHLPLQTSKRGATKDTRGNSDNEIHSKSIRREYEIENDNKERKAESSRVIGEGNHQKQQEETQLKQAPVQTTPVEKEPPSTQEKIDNKKQRAVSKQKVEDAKKKFYARYGGKEVAETLLKKGIFSFGSAEVTAKRMVRAAANARPFVVAFGGYSVTVGRGNFFHQSFPFILKDILQGVFKEVLDIELVVRNSAIGGIPSFPYGWCLENFLGRDADVISWDYAMNEGSGGPSVFEAYVRQSLLMPNRPMLITIDTKPFRRNLLKQYQEAEIIEDAIAVAKGEIVPAEVLQKPEEERPEGFKDWDKWGAPKGSPGQSKWHPKMQEHALIGWMISMYFLDAIDKALTILESDTWKTDYRHDPSAVYVTVKPSPVLHKTEGNSAAVTALMYGSNEKGTVSCRTSFLPAIDHTKTLSNIAISGLAPINEDWEASRDDSVYEVGWVMDVGKLERTTKRKVTKIGGLGYIDQKVGLFGIPQSGTIRLWLPHERGAAHDGHEHDKEEDKNASHWYDALVICEINEKRPDSACKLDKDVSYKIGGVTLDKSQNIQRVAGAGEYLGYRTCVEIPIPASAMVTKRKELTKYGGEPLSPEIQDRFKDVDEEVVGLILDVSVLRTNVTRAEGACVISHIIWESI